MDSWDEKRFEETVASPYWRTDDAAVVLRALESSGMSLSAFCRRHRLTRSRVERWRRRLTSPDPPPTFYPVRLTGTAAPAARSARPWTVRVPGGIVLEVPSEEGREALVEALEVVRQVWSC